MAQMRVRERARLAALDREVAKLRAHFSAPRGAMPRGNMSSHARLVCERKLAQRSVQPAAAERLANRSSHSGSGAVADEPAGRGIGSPRLAALTTAVRPRRDRHDFRPSQPPQHPRRYKPRP